LATVLTGAIQQPHIHRVRAPVDLELDPTELRVVGV
jgi:hypothetical protein